MSQILFYLGLIIMPLEWKVPTFPTLHSLLYKCCSLTINLVNSFPSECVKKWQLYLERETDLTWSLSYFLLAVRFLPDSRDKIKTPLHKLSFFLMFKGFCTTLFSIFITTSNKISEISYFPTHFLFKWEDDTVAIFGTSTYLKGKK